MKCEPGELVLIPFPYSDLSSTKRRPVLTLTPPDRHGDFICLAITSVQIEDHAISITTTVLSEGQLPKASWVRLDKIFTLSSENIVKSFGRLKEDSMEKVRRGYCLRIGCK